MNGRMIVTSIRRYPVKSMLGEEVASTVVTQRGLAGDRGYALVDATDGHVASAKNPRKWGQLFECSARFASPPTVDGTQAPVELRLPDGASVRSDAADADAALSRALGRDVRLQSTPPVAPMIEEYSPDIEGIEHRGATTDLGIGVLAPGTFFDAAPVHIVTTATLAQLSAAYPSGQFNVARFRPNIVVDCGDEEGFVENGWLGKVLVVGDGLRLQVVIAAPRCVMTTLPQGSLPSDSNILRTIAQHNRVEVPTLGPRPCVGVYAIVAQPGSAQRGDAVRVE